MKEHGLTGACGEHVPQHVIQGREPEQDPTRVANHALGSHQKLEIVSVSFVKKNLSHHMVISIIKIETFSSNQVPLKKGLF